MKQPSNHLEEKYAEACKKMPFHISFVDKRYYCASCSHKGVTIRYFYMMPDGHPTDVLFCCEVCMNLYLIKRL